MILYGLKTCDTCRKALKSLPDAVLVDVSVTPVPDDVLARALGQFGENLCNTRSTTWREFDVMTRSMAPKALIKSHPKVMKRPLIDTGDALYLGWGADTRAALGVA